MSKGEVHSEGVNKVCHTRPVQTNDRMMLKTDS